MNNNEINILIHKSLGLDGWPKDYCGDLNEMNKLENSLSITDRGKFRKILRKIDDRECGYGESICHASARSRAQAFYILKQL
jgi:hypothetical protein